MGTADTTAHVAAIGTLVSIGYEGKTVVDLVAQLLEQGVRVLVDVRLTPLSRKPGLSKSKLAEALVAVGIIYVHHRAGQSEGQSRRVPRRQAGVQRPVSRPTRDRRGDRRTGPR